MAIGVTLYAAQYYNYAKTEMRENQSLVAWLFAMEPILAEAAKRDQNVESGGDQLLLSLISQVGQQYEIPFERVEPKGRAAAAWVKNVPFNSLLAMLLHLRETHGIEAAEVQLSGGSSAALCSGRLLLTSR